MTGEFGPHPPGVRLSVVVMHHPARRDAIPGLVRACRPLRARVVEDPRPDGPPSPLRTAKLAWAAVAEGATHHLVLQDDVLPMRGFARHVTAAVAARPDHGIALFVHGKSPHNSYAVRRATAGGEPWAGLSREEWTPTLGLVLPAADARALARYLSRLPDQLLDDDDFVTPFCAGRGLPVLATVPHLLDHGDLPSLSGYDEETQRHATVFDPRWKVPDAHWRAPCGPAGAGHAVELRDSRCVIRRPRPGTAEPLLHPFGWYWLDWCHLGGVDAGRVVAAFSDLAPQLDAVTPPHQALEVFAAGYLLVADSPGRPPASGFAAGLVRPMVESWLDCGLAPADRVALTDRSRHELVYCALSGMEAADHARQPGPREAVHAV
jgi:hypothetical protein